MTMRWVRVFIFALLPTRVRTAARLVAVKRAQNREWNRRMDDAHVRRIAEEVCEARVGKVDVPRIENVAREAVAAELKQMQDALSKVLRIVERDHAVREVDRREVETLLAKIGGGTT